MSPTETNGQLQGLLLRKTLLLIASLVPAIAITPGARADICFEYGSGGGTSVAKGAKVPPVNTCIRVTPVDLGARLGVATGSICQVFLAVQRSRSGRRLPRVRAAVCRRQYPVGGMLGPCEAQILRGASGNRLPRRGRSIETHRRALRDRGDHPRPANTRQSARRGVLQTGREPRNHDALHRVCPPFSSVGPGLLRATPVERTRVEPGRPLITVWLEVRILPGPPRSPMRTNVSRSLTNSPQFAGISAGSNAGRAVSVAN